MPDQAIHLDLPKDLDRSREEGAGLYLEMLAAINMAVRDLVREGGP